MLFYFLNDLVSLVKLSLFILKLHVIITYLLVDCDVIHPIANICSSKKTRREYAKNNMIKIDYDTMQKQKYECMVNVVRKFILIDNAGKNLLQGKTPSLE